jgi:hypothetical protein
MKQLFLGQARDQKIQRKKSCSALSLWMVAYPTSEKAFE